AALDVAQRHHGALARWQGLDRAADAVANLAGEEALVGDLAPRRGRRGPSAGVARVVGREEAIGIDRWAVVAGGLERGERHAPRLAPAPRLRSVGEDPHDPGLERGAALEGVDAGDDRAPRLLDDFLGDRAGAHV